MTATDFQTLAIGWIGTAVVVGGALIAAYATLKGKIDDLQSKHEHNADMLQSHEDRITNLDDPTGQPRNVSLPDPQAFRQPLGQPQKPSV